AACALSLHAALPIWNGVHPSIPRPLKGLFKGCRHVPGNGPGKALLLVDSNPPRAMSELRALVNDIRSVGDRQQALRLHGEPLVRSEEHTSELQSREK